MPDRDAGEPSALTGYHKDSMMISSVLEMLVKPAKSRRALLMSLSTVAAAMFNAPFAHAQPRQGSGSHGEASLRLPDLSQVTFQGVDGHKLLLFGLVICAFGLLFGFVMYTRLKNLPVHKSMREISELIYETCKTYLVTQGKFILILEAFIAVIIALYFGVLRGDEFGPGKVAI